MLRIDRIHVKKSSESLFNLQQLQTIVEKKLKEAASATKLRSTQKGKQLEVILGKPVSLQTVNQIFRIFTDEGIKIRHFSWNPMKVGIFELGILEVTVS